MNNGKFSTMHKLKLTKLGANCHELTLANGDQLLFSYSTPVALKVWSASPLKRYTTARKWNRTTSGHINRWIGDPDGIELVPQETLDGALGGLICLEPVK